ncbi:MAG: ACP S-malonyltransferase [Acidimicrobiales bacterium]
MERWFIVSREERVLAFTFPGQGSQRPGMGAPWREHPSFELVADASEITGRDIAQLVLEAERDTLTRTDNAQLATFVMSLVVLDAAERLGIEPGVCAGHSLGEYSALVASGAIDLESGLHLVAERGAAMQNATEEAPGTMAAVLGLDDDGVEAACLRAEGDAWVANYNAPGHVVIAGSAEAVTEAGRLAKELGAKKVLPIPVGGAFHTPLMAPARERLRKALADVTFHPPEPVIIANVDARPHQAAADWPSLLSAQLCSPVRWRQTIDALLSEGTQTFVELGPGGVLTGLARRLLPTPETIAISVSTPDDLQRLVEVLAGESAPMQAVVEQRAGEKFHMDERLILSPAAGLFEPAAGLELLTPGRTGIREAVTVEVGGLVGHVGTAEIRSAFAGSVEGILVLPGERVTSGQPVAWLRATGEGAS